jgi:hypothetical protein
VVRRRVDLQGTVAAMITRAADRLGEFLDLIGDRLAGMDVVGLQQGVADCVPADAQTAARADKVTRKYNALAHRLIDRETGYLQFTKDWRVPTDRNLAT